MPGRIRGFAVGPQQGNNADLEQTFGYATNGRFETLTTNRFGTAAATRTFRYAYLSNSHLIQSLSIDGSHPFTITRGFASTRDLLTSIETKWSTTLRTGYAYAYDERAQRASVVQSGDVFADYGDSTFRLFSYDGRGQLTLDAGFLGSSTSDQSKSLPGRRHGYAYDNIGNRKWSDRTGIDTNSDGLPDLRDDYTTDATNQYTEKENNTIPLSGTAATDSGGAGGTAVVVQGRTVPAGRQGRYWNDEITVNNVTAPWRGAVSIYTAKRGTTDLARIDSRTVEIGKTTQTYTYDNDGNITSDGINGYTWDAENRLIKVETTSGAMTAGFPRRVVEFRYDHQHRRVQKQVLEENAASQLVEISCRRYLYDSWNLVAEYAAPAGTSIGMLLKTYTWGLDHHGQFD